MYRGASKIEAGCSAGLSPSLSASPTTVPVPDEHCCDRSSEGEREALLVAGAARLAMILGAGTGGGGDPLWGMRSHWYGGAQLERS